MAADGAVVCPSAGGLLPGINSIATAPSLMHSDASSSNSDGGFGAELVVTAHDDSSVRLWDLRAPAKPAAYVTAKRMPGDDTLEVCNVGGRFASVALCGAKVAEVDWRNPSAGPSRAWEAPCDLSAIDRVALSEGSAQFAVADDEGRCYVLASQSFELVGNAFGEHASIPCGVFSLGATGAVLSIGMEGSAKLWRGDTGVLLASDDLCDSCWRERTPQMANPPIPTCAEARRAGLVVGRGDGTFAVARLPTSEKLAALVASEQPQAGGLFADMMFSPAHAGDGLVAVAWCSAADNDVALTAAVSGQVMLWNVAREFAEAQGDAEDDDEEGPQCLFAFDLREDVEPKGQVRQVNRDAITVGAAAVCGERIAVGDNAGRLVVMPVA